MSLIHSIPLFTIVLSLLTSVICSIVNAKWAKRIYAVTGLIVIGLTTFLMIHTVQVGEAFVFMMGHFPAPWGNEIQVGPLESSLASIFSLILYLSVFGGLLKLKDDIRESKRNLYCKVTRFCNFAKHKQNKQTIAKPKTHVKGTFCNTRGRQLFI